MHPLNLFKYCPKCGSADFVVNNEKSKRCENCGFIYYFNSSAAVVAFIVNKENQLLVCRRAKEPAKGTLDLPGGFIDMCETAEEGIIREVREETGLEVHTPAYLFSLPNLYEYSGFLVHTLDLFFLIHLKEDYTLIPQDDVEEAWFVSLTGLEPDKFGLQSIKKGITHFLINYR